MVEKKIILNSVDNVNITELVTSFSKLRIIDSVIHQAVKNALSNRRAGSASVKNRSDVKGSNKKPWAQKGSGHARAGSCKSPIWRGGGVVFGPVAKSYRYKLASRKVKQLAISGLLAKAFLKKQVRIVEYLAIKEGKTKEIIDLIMQNSKLNILLGQLSRNKFCDKIKNNRLLIISETNDRFLKRVVANLYWLNSLAYNQLNILDLFYSDEIFIEKNAFVKMGQLLKLN